MSGDVFDIGRSDWEIVFSEDEISEVWPLVARCLSERSREVVWLVARSNGTRTWLFDMETVWAWRNTIGEPVSTQIVLPIPLMVFFSILNGLDDSDEARLYYNSNDDAFVVRISNGTQFVDYPRNVDTRDVVSLYEFFTDTSQQQRIATMAHEDFQKFAPLHQTKPSHVDIDSLQIAPYLTVQFADGAFRATTDWRRAGGPRVTTSHPAQVVEELTFSCVGGLLGRIFGGEVEEGNLTVSVDDDYDHVFVTYGSTGCCIDVQHEYVMRWIFSIYQALDSLDGTDIDSTPGPNMGPTVRFGFLDIPMYATLIEGSSDAEDRVRISALVADLAGDNEPTFREINALNESLANIKVVFRDDEVYAIIDLHPANHELIHDAVRRLGETITRFEGIDTLFATYA